LTDERERTDLERQEDTSQRLGERRDGCLTCFVVVV